MGAGRDVGLSNDDRFGGLFSVQRNRIAATRRAYGLSVDRRGAVLAHHAIWSLVETHRSANLAGVEYSCNFAIGFLVEPEANLGPMLFGLEAMKLAIRDLGQRNVDLSILESHFRRRGQRVHALGVDEFSRDHHDEEKRTGVDRNHPEAFAAS